MNAPAPTRYQRTDKAAARRCYVFLNTWLEKSRLKGKHVKNDLLCAWISTLRADCYQAGSWREMLEKCEETIACIEDPDLKEQVSTVFEVMLDQCEKKGMKGE